MSSDPSARRTIRSLTLLLWAGLLGISIGAAAAIAWTPENLDCNVPYDEYRLVDWSDEQPPSALGWSNLTFTDWTAGAEANFDDGADNWEDVDRPNDTNVVNITKVSSGGIPFWHVDLSQSGAGGVVLCDGGQLYGAVDYTELGGDPLGNDHQKGLATHEMGHSLGIHHVGTNDNRWSPSNEPSMVGGAANSYKALRTLTPDDWVSLTSFILNDGYMTYNGYFSQGDATKGWDIVSGSFDRFSAGGVNNSAYARLEDKNSKVRSTSWVWYNGGIRTTASTSLKVPGASQIAAGDVTIRLTVRRLEATGTEPTGVFDFLDTPTSNPDINNSAFSGSWIVAEEHTILTPPTSWTERHTLQYTIPSYWEGAAVRIRIKNGFVDEFISSIPVYLDNTRIQEQP